MATKKDNLATIGHAPGTETNVGTALTVVSQDALALDPLAGVLQEGDTFDETGTEALAGTARIPRLAFNLTTITGDDGKPKEIRKTVFVQTVSGVIRERVRLQIVIDHVSRQWKEQVDGKGVVRCSSWDAVTGQFGEERIDRHCHGCPDYAWRKDDKGKNKRNCGDVHNVVALDLDTADVVIVAVKKTAIKPWRDYYAKHFQKQRGIRDPKTGMLRKVDLPFFARETLLELKLVQRNAESWAEPVFAPGPILSREHIQNGLQALVDWKSHQADVAARGDAIEAQAAEGGDKPDTSFDFGENRDAATDGMR